MNRRRWFLPETPDVLGTLREQFSITIEGAEAFARWAAGEPGAAAAIDDADRRGDVVRRGLLEQLRTAFVTPLEPEDLFALSRGAGRILDYAHDVVSESALMDSRPDEGVTEMARCLLEALRHLDAALAALKAHHGEATRRADAAIASVDALDDAYARGMAALLVVEDRADRIGRRELYRRCERLGEVTLDVAERVIYAVVKQS